ncbi:nucleotidyl transferase AbiEii/AbiGii toxin family protein [Selenomonas montiformis]|uniref:nucleotidyl transferase AbiEii/AbiGii toxin family protein n=1 Tax=Selenomonas montiformis TaxID=2652285 RepID=UPI0039F542FA
MLYVQTPVYLLAGKLHAVLCRNWRNRVKGRDLYDLSDRGDIAKVVGIWKMGGRG